MKIAREVAEALDYAHAEGVVHGDVKPQNGLLSRGHALVADFGVARAVSMAVYRRRQAVRGVRLLALSRRAQSALRATR